MITPTTNRRGTESTACFGNTCGGVTTFIYSNTALATNFISVRRTHEEALADHLLEGILRTAWKAKKFSKDVAKILLEAWNFWQFLTSLSFLDLTWLTKPTHHRVCARGRRPERMLC